MTKENVASTVLAFLAACTVAFAFANLLQLQPHVTVFSLAVGTELLVLALSPNVLFVHVTYGELKNEKGFVRHGYAALARIVTKVFVILGTALYVWSLIQ
jgi:hypothetical protein